MYSLAMAWTHRHPKYYAYSQQNMTQPTNPTHFWPVKSDPQNIWVGHGILTRIETGRVRVDAPNRLTRMNIPHFIPVSIFKREGAQKRKGKKEELKKNKRSSSAEEEEREMKEEEKSPVLQLSVYYFPPLQPPPPLLSSHYILLRTKTFFLHPTETKIDYGSHMGRIRLNHYGYGSYKSDPCEIWVRYGLEFKQWIPPLTRPILARPNPTHLPALIMHARNPNHLIARILRKNRIFK